jgi:putative oxidoreductase
MATNIALWAPRMLSVLRIITGLLFLEHGTQKLLGFPPSEQAAPALLSLIGVQGILELVGGFLILIGLFTRPVAFSSPATWRSLTSWRMHLRASFPH